MMNSNSVSSSLLNIIVIYTVGKILHTKGTSSLLLHVSFVIKNFSPKLVSIQVLNGNKF